MLTDEKVIKKAFVVFPIYLPQAKRIFRVIKLILL